MCLNTFMYSNKLYYQISRVIWSCHKLFTSNKLRIRFCCLWPKLPDPMFRNGFMLREPPTGKQMIGWNADCAVSPPPSNKINTGDPEIPREPPANLILRCIFRKLLTIWRTCFFTNDIGGDERIPCSAEPPVLGGAGFASPCNCFESA